VHGVAHSAILMYCRIRCRTTCFCHCK